ncbi:retron Ec78 anti-phage system effector ATPase PtuA [Thalassotalea sp. SU-HH00458]|uniref:retron Ec78 anti-phage system effector ATPase PtuA n=1 Tax=Thalassotalea sp. SU-HH00458 TaxID=3127657 RepID=UPI003107CDD9
MNKPDRKEHSKTIKNLKQNAVKGNLLSMFQLYENYSTGKNVEAVNEELAQTYMEMIVDKLPSLKFKVSSINLHEFRRFRDLDIHFNNQVTVIIGDNGAGKTSIAESLAKALTWFNRNLVKSNVSGKKIVESDINSKAKDYSELIGKFQLDKDNKFEISLASPISGYSGNVSGVVATAKQFGDMYRMVAEHSLLPLPLFAFYSVERSSVKLPKASLEKALLNSPDSRFDALKDSLEASTQLDDFTRLYIELYNLAEGEETQEIKESKQAIQALEKLINKFHSGKKVPDDNELAQELKLEKKNLASLLGSKSIKHQKLLKWVNDAIETLVPDVKDLTVDRSSGSPRILVNNFGNRVNVSQLSQGQKSLLALTGDLALRLSTLNPDIEFPLSGHGIVIIDEVELHLHPRWQQEVLLGLQKTFPNIQFIVTTHSPQILSTVDNKCIRQICFGDDSELLVSTPQFQTKGVTSADILARIMGTNSVPEHIEEAKWLNDFSRLLKANDKKSRDEVFLKIKAHFGDNHPVVADCESQIRIMEMNARLKKES